MLNIYFNRKVQDTPFDNFIANPDKWFDNQCGEDYITGDLERQMILDIDKSVVVSNHLIESPVLGPIPPYYLSGTVKTLILIKNRPDKIFNGSSMGDLAAPWLLKMSEFQDITIRLGYLMEFSEPFQIRVLNSNKIVTTFEEYLYEFSTYVYPEV